MTETDNEHVLHTEKIASPIPSTSSYMPPSENAVVRSINQPRQVRRADPFNQNDYPLIFDIYTVAERCEYLPLGFKEYLYNRTMFCDDTLYRLLARYNSEITENGRRGFQPDTTAEQRCFAMIRWLYNHQPNEERLRKERDGVRKFLARHRTPLTRENILKFRIPIEIPLPMKGYPQRLKYHRNQSASDKLICPLCFLREDRQMITMNSISSFHDHMLAHGYVDLFGCHKCHRIYPEQCNYESHVCKDQEPKSKVFPEVIYALVCPDCGFATRYDIHDERKAEENMTKFRKLLLNHDSRRLVVIKLSTTYPGKEEGKPDESQKPWMGQMKLRLRRPPGHCNLPDCSHIELADERSFRKHLCEHMKANRIPFVFCQFLKKIVMSDDISVKGVTRPQKKREAKNGELKKFMELVNLETEDCVVMEMGEGGGMERTEQYVGPKPVDWIEDMVPFKINFADPLPGVANSTARMFMCKRCYLITFGNNAAMTHIKDCQQITDLKFTKKIIFASDYVWHLGEFNHLPSEPIHCVMENCKAHLCSIQGFVVHLAERHGMAANIDFNSSGGYGIDHRETWFSKSSYVSQQVNQFCFLNKDGNLLLNTETNEMSAQYSEEVLATGEDADLSWLDEADPYEEPEEPEEELEPRDLYPTSPIPAVIQPVDEERIEVAGEPAIPVQRETNDLSIPSTSSAPLTVPKLRIKLGETLSTDTLEANGLSNDETLPADYLRKKKEKDEKRHKRRENKRLEEERKRKAAEESVERTAEQEKRQNEPIVFNFENRCFDCGLEFPDPDKMTEHYGHHGFVDNSDKFSIRCYPCAEFFKDLNLYLQHMVKVHSTENPNRENPKQRICKECRLLFTNENFVNHIRYSCYLMKRCGQCGIDMTKQKHAERTSHMVQKHKDTKRFWCNCKTGPYKTGFPSLVDFEYHICAEKELTEITMNKRLLLGARVDEKVTRVLNKDREIPVTVDQPNQSSVLLQEILTASSSRESSEQPRGKKRKATYSIESEPLGVNQSTEPPAAVAAPEAMDTEEPRPSNTPEDAQPSTSSGQPAPTATNGSVDDDDEIICLSLSSVEDDIEVIAPPPVAPVAEIITEDGDVMVVDAPTTSRPTRPHRFHCDICKKGYKTQGAMLSHKSREHHRDICTLDKHLTQNVYGVPYSMTTYLCPHCVMVFETEPRHKEHMEFHAQLGTDLLMCEYCSVQALSHEGMNKHLLHHGIDNRTQSNRQPIQIENWCSICAPMLSFPSDAGYYLHVYEAHHVPIYFFCKNCLMGSCDPNLIVQHIMSGQCTEKRVYERTVGFAIASDLHFQPNNEEAYKAMIEANAVTFVSPHTCTSRSFVKYHHKNATCEEVERPNDPDKCFSLINFFSFENRICRQLNYHVSDSSSLPVQLLPDHRFCNLDYNFYRYLDLRYRNIAMTPLTAFYERQVYVQQNLPDPLCRNPVAAVGRTTVNRALQPRVMTPLRMPPSSGQSAIAAQLAQRQAGSSRSPAQLARNGIAQVQRQPLAPHHPLQVLLLNSVPEPERRLQFVKEELIRLVRQIETECASNVGGPHLDQLRARHRELLAMEHRLNSQIAAEQQNGRRLPEFEMSVPQNEIRNYQLMEMIGLPPRQLDPQWQLPQQQPAVQTAANPEILRAVHQNQQMVVPRQDNRRAGVQRTATQQQNFQCAACGIQLSEKVAIQLIGKPPEDYANAIIRSTTQLPQTEVVNIRQRMAASAKVCWKHVNPHGVEVINGMFIVVNKSHMVAYSYVDFASPALNQVAYNSALSGVYDQLAGGAITHQHFLNTVRSANRCREASCRNTPLSNMPAAKLHSYHVSETGLATNQQKMMICTFCWKSFQCERDILAHMMAEHSGAHERVPTHLICPIPNCAIGFDNPINLQAHFRTQHHQIFKHIGTCGQPFHTNDARAEHDATHNLVRRAACCQLCGVCSPHEGLIYDRTTNLSHYHRHACTIKYTCKICMEGFVTHSQLIAHCRAFHDIGGRQPLSCRYCNQSLAPQEVPHHISTTHELHLFAINLTRPVQIICPPEMSEFLGLLG